MTMAWCCLEAGELRCASAGMSMSLLRRCVPYGGSASGRLQCAQRDLGVLGGSPASFVVACGQGIVQRGSHVGARVHPHVRSSVSSQLRPGICTCLHGHACPDLRAHVESYMPCTQLRHGPALLARLTSQVPVQVYAIETCAADCSSACRVVSVDCHIGAPHLFLTAHDSGLVCLHHSGVAGAVRTWGCREDVVAALWLSERSLQFLALHGDGSIAVCDAARPEDVPVTWTAAKRLDQPIVHAFIGVCAGTGDCTWLLLCSGGGCEMHQVPVLEAVGTVKDSSDLEYWRS